MRRVSSGTVLLVLFAGCLVGGMAATARDIAKQLERSNREAPKPLGREARQKNAADVELVTNIANVLFAGTLVLVLAGVGACYLACKQEGAEERFRREQLSRRGWWKG